MSLHTSFLRVIMHHEPLQAGYRLPLKLTGLQTPPVAGPVALLLISCESGGDDSHNRNRKTHDSS